jgi:hypothetical protein
MFNAIQIVDFPPWNNWYLHQFSIFLNADLTIGFASVRALKWAIHRSIMFRVDEFDQNFYKVLDELIIFYKKLIHFLDNNKFANKIWSTTLILNIIERWIAHFKALTEANPMVKSAFKNIENWWRYQLFHGGKSTICMALNIQPSMSSSILGQFQLELDH